MDRTHLLVVEDDADTRELLTQLLRDQGFEVLDVATIAEGIDAVETHAFDLVVSSIFVPRKGEALASVVPLVEAAHPTPVGVTSTEPINAVQLRAAGARFALRKPFDLDLLLERIAAGLDVTLTDEQRAQALVAERYFELLTARDWDAFAALCSDDVVYELPGAGPYAATVHGRTALRDFTRDTFSQFPAARFAHVSVHALPHALAARYESSWPTADGSTAASAGAVILQFEGTRISRIGVRLNAERLARVAGK